MEIFVLLICQQVGKIWKNLNEFLFLLRFLILLLRFGRHDQDIVLTALLGECVRVVRIASIVVLVVVIDGKSAKKKSRKESNISKFASKYREMP